MRAQELERLANIPQKQMSQDGPPPSTGISSGTKSQSMKKKNYVEDQSSTNYHDKSATEIKKPKKSNALSKYDLSSDTSEQMDTKTDNDASKASLPKIKRN